LDQAIAVLDIGKTRSKLSLWAPDGRRLEERDHLNAPSAADPAQLDLAGIEAWLKRALAELAREVEITAIVPVAHGAAAVLMDGDAAVAALDYEAEPPPELAAAYDVQRDPFAAALSPRLPAGLNLGAQLFWLEQLYPALWPHRGWALLWPQYWAWVLSGERVSEVTSLGCHSDLWRPAERRFSDLALRRGWAERLGPLRRAADVLGPLRPALAAELGLSRTCRVHCGVHDSNAALVGARGLPELAGAPFSVVSTGTWVISMAIGGAGPAAYDPAEDMLANVDVDSRPVPTARFMGGRDYESWMGDALGAPGDPALLAQAEGAADWMALPPPLRAARAALELARRTDRALGLIAAEGPILIEGRFAADNAFAAALARLRPTQRVYRRAIVDGVAAGALRLAAPGAASAGALELIRPGDTVAPNA
jgi:sugar (pentulose or hexulose) kinase